MRKLTQKLTVIILLASLSLVVSACVKKPQNNLNANQSANQNTNDNQNTNVATTTAEIDTSNWKTYRNEEYEFEFKYPGDWYFDICRKEDGFNDVLAILSDTSIGCTVDMSESKISIEKVNNRYNWKSRLQNYVEKNTTINGYQFKQVSGDLPYEDPEGNIISNTWVRIIDMSIKIPDTDIYIVLRFHRGYGKIDLLQLEKDAKVYNDLVESFRFIKVVGNIVPTSKPSENKTINEIDEGKGENNDSVRLAAVNSILDAYLKYTVNNNYNEPVILIPENIYMIGIGPDYNGCSAVTTHKVVDLSILVNNDFLDKIPINIGIRGASEEKTFYYIYKTADNHIFVGSCISNSAGGKIKVGR